MQFFYRSENIYIVTLFTLFVGGVSALIAGWLNMPMGMLTGPAIGVALVSLWGARTDIAPKLRYGFFVFVGLNVGSMVTPTSIDALFRWPIAFSFLIALTVFTPYLGGLALEKASKLSPIEGYFAASPGHLSLVIALADSIKLSITRPTIIASFRLLALSLLVPIAARVSGSPLGAGLPIDQLSAPWIMIGAQVIASLALAPVLHRLRLPAPPLLAAMIVGAVAHLGGAVEGVLPHWLGQFTLITMGSLIGSRFTDLSLAKLKTHLKECVIALIIPVTLAVIAAIPAAYFSGLPLVDILIGFSPGALESMIIVGVAVGADPTFVATAHVTRLIVLALLLSAYATRFSRKQRQNS